MFQHQKLNEKHSKLIIPLKSSGFKFYLQLVHDFGLTVFVRILPDIQPQREHI